jgi:hypothetical protein
MWEVACWRPDLSPMTVANVANGIVKLLILLIGGEGVRHTLLHRTPTP